MIPRATNDPGGFLALHAPDGFLEPPVAAAAGVLALAVLAMALRAGSSQLGDRQIPLAGLAAAFVFAAQMVNFPVAAGTSGHLLGGALAAVLLGPWVGCLVVAVVVVVQALLFADGGLTALGINVLNMAIVTSFGGWATFRLLRRILPANASGVVGAAGVAAGVSVVLSAMAFSIEWLFGASAPVPFDTVFAAMVGVHLLIGVGEGVISGLVVASVLATRPDLVAGAADLPAERLADRAPIGPKPLIVAALAASFVVAAVVSQFASGAPDGLERVAQDRGFETAADEHGLADSIFADYATRGLDDESLSLAVAGITGVVLTLAVGLGLFGAIRSSGPVLAGAGPSGAAASGVERPHQRHRRHRSEERTRSARPRGEGRSAAPVQRPRSHLHLHLHGNGPVHRLAPEVKIVGLVAFVAIAALTPRRQVGVLAADLAIAAGLVVAARLPIRVVAARLLVIVPFVAFALFLPFIGGGEQTSPAGWLPGWPSTLTLSVDGLWATWNIVAKAVIGATASIVVAATTPVPDFLAGLGRLRLPSVLVAIVAFMFRYLDLVVDQFARTRRAMVARAHDPRWLWQARPLATASGTLFVRTYERGERVHGAMLARGWTGVMPVLDDAEPSRGQWLAALAPAAAAMVALVAALIGIGGR